MRKNFVKGSSLTESLLRLAKAEPNYAEAEKVLAVSNFCGLLVVVHADVPANEMHVVQNGRCIMKFVLK